MNKLQKLLGIILPATAMLALTACHQDFYSDDYYAYQRPRPVVVSDDYYHRRPVSYSGAHYGPPHSGRYAEPVVVQSRSGAHYGN